MASVKQTVYLISEQQRTALLGYLQNRPYREVAAGIQFLLNAPTAGVNVDVPEGAAASLAGTEELSMEEAVEAAREMAVV